MRPEPREHSVSGRQWERALRGGEGVGVVREEEAGLALGEGVEGWGVPVGGGLGYVVGGEGGLCGVGGGRGWLGVGRTV